MATGIRLSPGVYRDPKTGKIYQSTTGALPGGNKIPAVNKNPATGGTMTSSGATNTQATTQATSPWNEQLSNEAKRLRQIEEAKKLNTNQQTRLNELMALKANNNNPVTSANPTTVEQAATPTPAATPPPAAQLDAEMMKKLAEMMKKLAETLFPGGAPIDQDRIGKDLLYQDALKRGETVLNRRAAARGLLGSGAEMEAFNDFQSSLGAKTAERISNVDQQEAERLAKMQLDESLRRERAENNYWERNISLAELMQQQDPTNAIMAALGDSSGLTVDQAKDLASFLKSNFQTVRPNLSGGGGGTAFTPITAQPYNGSAMTPNQIAGDLSSSGGWTDTISTLLSGLLK